MKQPGNKRKKKWEKKTILRVQTWGFREEWRGEFRHSKSRYQELRTVAVAETLITLKRSETQNVDLQPRSWGIIT